MSEIAKLELGWLKQFFSGRNALKWEAIVAGTAPNSWLEQVSPWLTLIAEGEQDSPILLPVFDELGAYSWYAIASDEHQATALAEDLMACIGPSYSDFRGIALEVDHDDMIESALYGHFGRYLYRLNADGDCARENTTQAVKRYFQLVRRRPVVTDRTQQPFGKLRGDFDRALLAGNGAQAAHLLDAMIGTGRVDAAQRQFLEIRRLAGLGRGVDIARNFPLLRSILDLSLPPQTLTDVVDALYVTHLADIEHTTDPISIIASFKSEIRKPFGPLFRERKGVRHPSVLKAFLLYELSHAKPNPNRCEALIASAPSSELRELLQSWTAVFQAKNPQLAEADVDDDEEKSTLSIVKQALLDEDYEIAAKLCFEALPDQWAYSQLLRCAMELGDNQLNDKVLDAIAAADDVIRSGLSERDHGRIDALRGNDLSLIAMATAGQSWLNWCDATIAGTDATSLQLLLENSVLNWQVEEYISSVQEVQLIAERIANAQGQAEQVFRAAYAHLVEFFALRPERPVRAFAPMYGILVKIIAWNGGASADELALTADVAQALLAIGPDKNAYVDLIEDLLEILSANRAPTTLDWALNAAELLAVQPAPDENIRLQFFMRVVDLVNANLHRISSAQRAMLELLAKDFNCLELIPHFSKVDDRDDFNPDTSGSNFNGLIGLYTLTESAGIRAKRVLEKLLPAARIEFNSDHAASDRLRQLATNSDVFVFAWKSSKHQAYYCVKDARGDRNIKMPLGKGSASIISSVFEEISRDNFIVDFSGSR